MKSHCSKVRVRYGETDQMGVVHHGNYPQYFELARLEWLEKQGISYKELEREGIMLPVYQMSIIYKKPAFFDDELSIQTVLKNKPTVKIEFHYILRNKVDEILTEADTTLVFTDAKSKRPIRCPKYILKAIGFK